MEKILKIDGVTISIINPEAIPKLKEKMIEFIVQNEPYREIRLKELEEKSKNKLTS